MTHASVFSGIGGPEVAASMLGWENLFHCEINPFGRRVLEYWYPEAKSYEDITKTDFSEWRGRIDVLSGGFPCQPFSYAGKRGGAEDDRYLWPYMFRCIDQVRPAWVVAENVAGILTMVEQGEVSALAGEATLFDEGNSVHRYELRETFTLERICRDLQSHGYSVQPVLVPACAVGAPHRRDRVFIVGRRDAVSENAMCGGQLYRQDGEQGSERNERNAGAGSRFRIRRDAQRAAASDPACRGEGTSGEGGSTQGDRGETDKQQSQRGAATEWSDRFYAVLRDAANADGHRGGEVYESLESELADGAEPLGNGRERFVAHAGDERLSAAVQSGSDGAEERDETERRAVEHSDRACPEGARWDTFPSVSPVHSGNDGIPIRLDGISIPFSRWRTEALKAYGNAIVPQVMYEIFRAIEATENHGNCRC